MAQKQNGHLTIEQLSALLDKQLSVQEEAQSEAHLRNCQQCQDMLNDLRQTVALLHALPQPILPRSFVLSPAMLGTAAPPQEPTVPVTIQIEERRRQRQQRQQARRYVLPRTLRVMSTLVALLGFIFLVSAIPFHTGGASNSSAGSSTSAPYKPTTVAPSSTLGSHNVRTKPGQGTTSTQTPAATRHSTSTAPAIAQWLGFLDPWTQPGRAIDGLLLLVLAFLGLLIARRWRLRVT